MISYGVYWSARVLQYELGIWCSYVRVGQPKTINCNLDVLTAVFGYSDCNSVRCRYWQYRMASDFGLCVYSVIIAIWYGTPTRSTIIIQGSSGAPAVCHYRHRVWSTCNAVQFQPNKWSINTVNYHRYRLPFQARAKYPIQLQYDSKKLNYVWIVNHVNCSFDLFIFMFVCVCVCVSICCRCISTTAIPYIYYRMEKWRRCAVFCVCTETNTVHTLKPICLLFSHSHMKSNWNGRAQMRIPRRPSNRPLFQSRVENGFNYINNMRTV